LAISGFGFERKLGNLWLYDQSGFIAP
jgi:hypothetical protein